MHKVVKEARCVIILDTTYSWHLTPSFGLQPRRRPAFLLPIWPWLTETGTLVLPYRELLKKLFCSLDLALSLTPLWMRASEMLRSQRGSCLPFQAGGCYVEKSQWSHGVLASGKGMVRTQMIIAQSLKVLALSEEKVVFSNQEQEWNRKRIQGKSILMSRLGCHCVLTALSTTNPLVSEPEPRLLFSLSYKVLRSVRSEGIINHRHPHCRSTLCSLCGLSVLRSACTQNWATPFLWWLSIISNFFQSLEAGVRLPPCFLLQSLW